MPIIKVRIQIKNSEENNEFTTKAILQDGILKYKEPNNTKVLFDYNENKLIRENNELKMIYYFSSSKKGILELKEYQKRIYLEMKTKQIKKKENDISILFLIEKNELIYQIEELK